jgi:hypothetical protein
MRGRKCGKRSKKSAQLIKNDEKYQKPPACEKPLAVRAAARWRGEYFSSLLDVVH